jgi:hypothetical protein
MVVRHHRCDLGNLRQHPAQPLAGSPLPGDPRTLYRPAHPVRRSGGTGATLVNTNGMAFFGPGSEWFWAALQFTALAITFIAIYRQLRVARSARAVELVAEVESLR